MNYGCRKVCLPGLSYACVWLDNVGLEKGLSIISFVTVLYNIKGTVVSYSLACSSVYVMRLRNHKSLRDGTSCPAPTSPQ